MSCSYRLKTKERKPSFIFAEDLLNSAVCSDGCTIQTYDENNVSTHCLRYYPKEAIACLIMTHRHVHVVCGGPKMYLSINVRVVLCKGRSSEVRQRSVAFKVTEQAKLKRCWKGRNERTNACGEKCIVYARLVISVHWSSIFNLRSLQWVYQRS